MVYENSMFHLVAFSNSIAQATKSAIVCTLLLLAALTTRAGDPTGANLQFVESPLTGVDSAVIGGLRMKIIF